MMTQRTLDHLPGPDAAGKLIELANTYQTEERGEVTKQTASDSAGEKTMNWMNIA